MSVDSEFLMSQGEWFAAGFFENPGASPIARMSRALRRQLENCDLPRCHASVFRSMSSRCDSDLPSAVGGEAWHPMLYPFGPSTLFSTRHNVLTFHYSYSISCQPALQERIDRAATATERAQWEALRDQIHAYPLGVHFSPRYSLGGGGWTHSIPNSGRVLAEGLDGYAKRIEEAVLQVRIPDAVGEVDKLIFYAGLEDVLAGVRSLHARMLEQIGLLPPGPARETLLRSMRNVPFAPARSFVEAVAGLNFVFYLDGCDSLGHVDRVLREYYHRDIASGAITRDRAVALVRELWQNFDENNGWNVAIGGSFADGRAAYDDFSLVCLEAVRGMRRPSLALKVRPDMPTDHWQEALDDLISGCGQPALYNDELYLRALKSLVAMSPQTATAKTQPGAAVPPETATAKTPVRVLPDVYDYAFAGCTETMVHGCSNVGSLDGGVNLLEFLLDTLRESLATCGTFEQLMEAYRVKLRREIAQMADEINRDQENKAAFRPHMIRSLLVDDCIESGREFNAGGARYNWSVINVGGLANVADSLAAVRRLVYGGSVSVEAMLRAMERDFGGDESLLAEVRRCPKFGNDDDEVDLLAREVSDCVFTELSRHACWRGGRLVPSCLMFVTYGWAGLPLSASPDGRRARQPIADSIGPHQGRDRKGPTAMLKSVAKLKHAAAAGTLVLNLRLAKSFFVTPSDRQAVIDLVQGYFRLGGMQLQISVQDQEVLRDAMTHPDRHAGLIVRIGGYSEFFNNLGPDLQRAVLERTEHVAS